MMMQDHTVGTAGSHRVTFQAVKTGATTYGYEIIGQ